jgi:hypothetical protein
MIPIYRKLRKKMADDNRPLKYARYAIGEIILVVIGILIALQINTWNGERLQKKKETRILMTLLDDLKQAELMSIDFIEREQNHIKLYEKILGEDNENAILINHPKNDSLFHVIIFGLVSQVPVIYSYSDLKNAGETRLISNKLIRRRFTYLENEIIDLNRQLADRLSVQQIRLDDIAIDELNFVQTLKGMPNKYDIVYGVENDYSKLFQNQKFLNSIGVKLALTDDAINERIQLLDEINGLIGLIEDELGEEME